MSWIWLRLGAQRRRRPARARGAARGRRGCSRSATRPSPPTLTNGGANGSAPALVAVEECAPSPPCRASTRARRRRSRRRPPRAAGARTRRGPGCRASSRARSAVHVCSCHPTWLWPRHYQNVRRAPHGGRGSRPGGIQQRPGHSGGDKVCQVLARASHRESGLTPNATIAGWLGSRAKSACGHHSPAAWSRRRRSVTPHSADQRST